MKFKRVEEKRYRLVESSDYSFERYRAKADRTMERNYSEDFEMLKYHKWYLDFEPEYIFLYATDYDTYVVVVTGYDKTYEFDTEEEAEKYYDDFFKDDEELEEDIDSGYILTHCPECSSKNRVFVKFPAFNKPFEDTQYTCDKCGARALVKDNHKYKEDGTIVENNEDDFQKKINEATESQNYRGYSIEASFYDKGDTNLYILKDNDFVTDENGKRKSFAWMGDAIAYIDSITPEEKVEKSGPTIEGKCIVNYLYFTGSKVTDVVKGKTEEEAKSKFTSWIRSNTSYNSISQFDKYIGFFSGYETEDGTIYVLRNGELCKNAEYTSFGGDPVPYSELKEGLAQNTRSAFRNLQSNSENKSLKEAQAEKDYTYRSETLDRVNFSIYEYTSGPKAGKVQISSSHPYDDADYHWAVSKDSGKTFRIYIDGPGQYVETFTNDSVTYDKVMARLLELDRAKKIKPRMVHN